MPDRRDMRIATGNLDHAAWECYEAGVSKERAIKIVTACYDDYDAEKKEASDAE